MQKNIHDGHRQRVRKEFISNGFTENTPPHKILEMLLFYSIPRCDTNELAHRLINHFGSFSAVLDASPKELMKIKGVGEKTAALIKLIMPIARLYINEKKLKPPKFYNYEEVCKYIIDKYCGYTEEIVAVTSFNSSGTIVGFDIIGKGDIAAVAISIRKLFETVLNRNATSVIISHNHPDGSAVPSPEDIETTKKLRDALFNINVRLSDHIIVSSDDCVSMRQTAAFKSIFNWSDD